ncbi:MAG: hypothetical protein ACKVH8_16650 [Pirellulales bacterium]
MNLIYELSDLSSAATLSGRLCLTLLHSIWIIALITLIASCVSRILQHRHVEQSYYVCVLGLFASIATLPITYSVLEVSQASNPVIEQPRFVTVTTEPAVAVPVETPEAGAFADVVETQTIYSRETSKAEESSASETISFLWPDIFSWIILAYVTGVALMIVRLGLSIYNTNRLTSTFTRVTEGPVFETLKSVSAK